MFFSDKKLVLAPMAGVTDTVFRRICKEQGADIVVSEMVSAEGLIYCSEVTEKLMLFDVSERPIGIQLFGSDPDHMARAAKLTYDKVRPDFIDINAGCPVAKVVKKNGGSGLLKNHDLFCRIVGKVAESVPVPVTVKIRSGWRMNEWVDVQFAASAWQCGAAAVTLHPRSQSMGFSGHSFWERITEVKKAVPIPVIGNGDIVSSEDALEMLRITGCDSVMIGREAFGNPWIFAQIKSALKSECGPIVTPEMKVDLAQEHVIRFKEMYGERFAYREMKRHVSRYIKGLSGASALRDRIFRAESTDQLLTVLKQILEMAR
ncbi:MAG: tRNA dihydrouridine synthase DusB [Fibrobacter sp.]|nr:tRNA dihydrouridine synthase DusB [Fibrobacter sp.]NLP04069.1 tRNA dihydrouridine synthase DusB [Fibrobacter sp.]